MHEPRRRRADVLIVGGGVMGCACAYRLAELGVRVTVLERSVPGAEASSAAAGILGAQIEAHGPGAMTELSLKSRALFPRWSRRLLEVTGIDVGYRPSGVMRLALDARGVKALGAQSAWQKGQGLIVERLSARQLHELEPALGPRVVGGVLYPQDARVDPRLLLRALHVAAQRAGAKFQTGSYVRRVNVERGRVQGVALDDGSSLPASHVVVAAGSWTTLVGGLGLPSAAVRPARGQIIELVSAAPLVTRVVFGPRCYLVPRDDGRTLVGSTLEFVGYRREVTAGATRDLLAGAIELVPALGQASLNDAWSNFRPYTDDELPLIGSGGAQGLTFATGHYRNGILLAPITAEIVAARVLGRRPPLPLAPFSPERLIKDASR